MEQNKIKRWKYSFKYNNNFNIYARRICPLHTTEGKEVMARKAMVINIEI